MYLNKVMNSLKVGQIVILHVNTDTEVETSIPSVNYLEIMKLQKENNNNTIVCCISQMQKGICMANIYFHEGNFSHEICIKFCTMKISDYTVYRRKADMGISLMAWRI